MYRFLVSNCYIQFFVNITRKHTSFVQAKTVQRTFVYEQTVNTIWFTFILSHGTIDYTETFLIEYIRDALDRKYFEF